MLGPKETIALALGNGSALSVRQLANEPTAFRVSFTIRLPADILGAIGNLAKKQGHSLGAQLYTYTRKALRDWRPIKPKPADDGTIYGAAAKIASRYGE